MADANYDATKYPVLCYAPKKVSSSGVWNGNDPVDFSLPLIMLQITIVVLITRAIHFLLKPLKQPKIVSEIIGGIIVGPSFLSSNATFYKVVFPDQGVNMMRNTAALGMVYSLFIISVKTDPSLIAKTGKKALIISLWGLFLPFITVMVTRFLLRKNLPEDISKGPFFIVVAASLSMTYFPNLQPVLSDLNLLNSDPGQLTMSMSMINDLIGYSTMVLFGIAVQGASDPLKGLWFVVSLSALGIFIVFIIRPAMLQIVHRTPVGGPIAQIYIVAIMVGVLVIAFISDMIGATIVDGPLMLGLAMPDGPPLGAAIVKKTETVVEGLLMPLFFACVGLSLDWEVFYGHEWMPLQSLQFIFFIGCIAKLVGTLLPSLYFQIPFRDALAAGLIMNFRGSVELFTYAYWIHLQVLDNQSYGMMVLWTVMPTTVLTPFVSILCKPTQPSMANTRSSIQHAHPNTELCILACIHSEENVPAIINILEASHPSRKHPICVYLLHLIELIGRARPMLEAHCKKKKSNLTVTDQIVAAFKNYQKRYNDGVSIQAYISMSPYITMHKDICKLAQEREASLIIIPFHKQMTYNGEFFVVDPGLRTVNPKLLIEAPCSVGILVAHGLGRMCFSNHFTHCISVLFFGGPDDREALAYAARMAWKSRVSLTVMRILPADDIRDNNWEMDLDDEIVRQFRHKNKNHEHVVYREKVVKDGEGVFCAICSMENTFDLFIVGRRHKRNLLLNENLKDWSENPELGVIGDLLTSLDFGGTASVLVMQQCTKAKKYSQPSSKPNAYS